jgi:DNA-binding NtrC family response regulator
VLQNGEYIKVGSSKVQKTDVRIIAATNVNLAYAVATGKFREDLYYRLTGIQIQMPALRERNKDDIYLLFRKFSSDFSEKYNLCKVNLNHDAISLLTSYRWPGNIRQLKNIAETITAIESRPITVGSERVEIGPEVLMEYIPKEQGAIALSGPAAGKGSMSDEEKKSIFNALYLLKQEVDMLKEQIEELKENKPSNKKDGKFLIESPQQEAPSFRPSYPEYVKEEPVLPSEMSIKKANDDMIEACLIKHGGKVKPAAAELGISERTIYRKLAEKKKK